MTALHAPISPDWTECLWAVLEHAKALGERAVLAFDLDSTLFDNRPRQARIYREFGAARGLTQLLDCTAAHFASGWDLRAPLRLLGLPEAEIEPLYPELKAFWAERFFSGPYCLDDVPIPGAAEFVRAVAQTGARVCYVTGRHESMREGTEGALRNFGFPVPDTRVLLMMKPAPQVGDDDFKREAHQRLHALGTVIAAFDNEPTHANDYRRNFPEARIIHLATDHSGRPVALLEGIVSVPHFQHGR